MKGKRRTKKFNHSLRITLLHILLVCSFNASSQVIDTGNTQRSSRGNKIRGQEEVKHGVYKDSTRLMLESLPKKAAIRSAILPGWGQINNKGWGYVKTPIIWIGFGGLIYSYSFAQKNYSETLKEVRYRLENQGLEHNQKYAGASTEWLISAKDFYRRNRDITILLSVGWYALNVIDAYVDAKFKRYDMSDDFAFKVTPTLIQNYSSSAFTSRPIVGLKATFYIN